MTNDTYNESTVVLVHGIGDTTPGSVLDPAVLEIGKQLEGITQRQKESISSQASPVQLHSQSLRWDQFQIDLIEFHWSGFAGKINRTGFFTSVRYVLAMLWNLPRLGAWGSQSRARHAFANLFGGFLVVNLIVIMLLSMWIMSVDFFEFLEPDNFDLKSLDPVFELLVLYVPIPFAAVAFCLFVFNRKITQWAAQWLGVALGSGILFYAWILFSISFATVLTAVVAVIDVDHDLISFASLVLIPLGLLPFYVVVRLLAGLADLFRDVIHYLAVDENGNDHKDTLTIKSELHSLLDNLIRQGSTHIVLVAHSLGTAITAEILMERIDRPGQQNITYEFVTCGSPLKRTLHRLLPQRIPAPDEIYNQLKSQTSFKFGRWINIYRVADFVGTKLSRVGKPEDSEPDRDGFNAIEDILIEPWRKKPYSHGNYWGDQRFLNILISQLLKSRQRALSR